MTPLTDLFLGATRLSLARVLGRRPPQILLACMPKSASSFVAAAVGNLPGMGVRSISYSRYYREQEIDISRLARRASQGFIAHHHIRYSDTTGTILDQFGIAPVVQTRNVFDVVASLRDHMRNISPKWPHARFTPAHAELPDAELEQAITDLMMPWYLTFYISWLERPDALWIDYEEVRVEPAEVVARIAEHAGMRVSEAEIMRAVAAADANPPRYNQGVSGRGKAICPPARERLLALAAYYPDVDFAPLGISPDGIDHTRSPVS